jgi:hypothetical protein
MSPAALRDLRVVDGSMGRREQVRLRSSTTLPEALTV